MNPAQTRQHRARAAAILLNLHRSGELASLNDWSWERLDALPAWCLLSMQQRKMLQRVCGAVFSAPELRQWMDARLLRAACQVLGKEVFDAIVAAENIPAIAVPDHDGLSRCVLHSKEPVLTLDRELSLIGSGVLHSTLGQSSWGDSLEGLLEPVDVVVPQTVAEHVLLSATVLCEPWPELQDT